MSNSYKKTPIFGICGGSEKQDKRHWNRQFRRIVKQLIQKEKDPPTKLRAVTDVWDGNKDGKIFIKNASKKSMRK